MESYIIPIVICIIALVLGFIIGTLMAKTKQSELEVRNKLLLEDKADNALIINNLNQDKSNLNNERHELDLRYTQKVLELENLQEKLNENKAEVEQLQEKFTKDFEILANKILDKNSTKFTLQNKDHLKSILEPLQEKIQNFEKKVEDTHKESIDRHAALRQQIVGLKELNEQMSKEAVNLTKALKGDSKTQGDWGETQLEVLLEKSGLLKDVHYSTQGG